MSSCLRTGLGLALLLAAAAPVGAQQRAARAQAPQLLIAQRAVPDEASMIGTLSYIGAGIEKDKAGKVVGISLPSNASSTTYFRYVGSFKNLKKADFSDCRVYTTYAKHLQPLKNLEEVSLVRCTQLSDADFDYFKNNTKLAKLDLTSCSRLTDAGIAKLKMFKNLKELKLTSCTRLTDKSLDHLAALKNLEVLYIDQCRNLKAWDKLKAFPKLREVRVDYTNIDDAGVKVLAQLPNLKTLSLKYCRQLTPAALKSLAAGKAKIESLNLSYVRTLKDADLAPLAQMQSLKTLDMSSTVITDTGMSQLVKIPQLSSLVLSYVQVTDAGLKTLAKKQTLTQLQFYNGQFTDAGLAEIAKLPKLKHLELARCRKLTDKGLKVLANMKALEHLNLRSLAIKNAGLESLKDHKTLKQLNISSCTSLSMSCASTLATLKALHTLDLSNNRWVNTTVMRKLKVVPGLKDLNLTSTSVSSVSAKYIADMKNLETLRINYCSSIQDHGLARLTKLKKLKLLEVNQITVSTGQLGTVRRSMTLAKVVGTPRRVTVSRTTPRVADPVKILVLGDLDNYQKQELLAKMNKANATAAHNARRRRQGQRNPLRRRASRRHPGIRQGSQPRRNDGQHRSTHDHNPAQEDRPQVRQEAETEESRIAKSERSAGRFVRSIRLSSGVRFRFRSGYAGRSGSAASGSFTRRPVHEDS